MGLLEVASLCHPKIRPKVRITWAIKAGRFEFEVRPASITTRACPDDLSLNAAQGALDPPGFSPALRTRARALHRLKPAQLPLWPCGRLVTHGDLTEQAATCRNPTEVADTKQAVADRLGHADAAFTINTYAHSSSESDRAAAAAIEAFQ